MSIFFYLFFLFVLFFFYLWDFNVLKEYIKLMIADKI